MRLVSANRYDCGRRGNLLETVLTGAHPEAGMKLVNEVARLTVTERRGDLNHGKVRSLQQSCCPPHAHAPKVFSKGAAGGGFEEKPQAPLGSPQSSREFLQAQPDIAGRTLDTIQEGSDSPIGGDEAIPLSQVTGLRVRFTQTESIPRM